MLLQHGGLDRETEGHYRAEEEVQGLPVPG
jgi:hypothetical protein